MSLRVDCHVSDFFLVDSDDAGKLAADPHARVTMEMFLLSSSSLPHNWWSKLRREPSSLEGSSQQTYRILH